MSAMKDQLFNDPDGQQGDFQFTAKVAEVFDDMLERSIPFYNEIIDMSAQLIKQFVPAKGRIYDLGCSTGATVLGLARRTEDLQYAFTGVDNSSAMIEKAVLKAEMYAKQDRLEFIEADIFAVKLLEPAAIIMNYTLQFVRPMLRQEFLIRLYQALLPGGLFLLSEKTVCHTSELNRSFIQHYLNFKRRQGYSEIEISKKREALENILVPFSIDETLSLLRNAGFKKVEPFFQWFNFSSFVAIK
jgi:tRNA (cmo5U34)-methyltransferase